MKFKNTAIIFSLVLLLSIFNMGLVPAPSHPSYICGDGQVYDYIHDNGCSTVDIIWDSSEPPTFFGGFSHKLKFAFSNPETKVKLLAVLTDKQIAQLDEALAEGDYKKAEGASEDIRQTLEKSGRWLEEFSDEGVDYNEFYRGEGEFNDFLYMKNMYVQNIEHLNEIEGEILAKVDAGETTNIAVDGIFDALNNEGEVIAKIEEKENEFVDKVAEDGAVTELEIEYAINNYDKESGITDNYYKNYDSQDYAETMGKLDALRTEIADSDKPYSREVENLFDEARLRAQLAQTELQNEHYSDGYNEFYKSQYIVYNLENYIDEGEGALNDIDENVVVGPVELNKEIVEKNNQMIRDYELARNILLEKYPDDVDNLDSSYIVAQDVVTLTENMDKLAEQELTKLEEAGKTEEEAREIIEEKKAEEYYYNYGGRYFPPGYVEVSSDEETRETNYDYGGGFAKRYDYSNEADGIDYRFGDDGYSWTTWTGEKYSSPHSADYEPERVKRGDEVFMTEVKTADGDYNYEYYATGYIYTAPDGTETEVVYSDTADKIQFTGGTFVDYEPTGYAVTYQGGTQVWSGNPAFDNYINLADGKVFIPKVSSQGDATYNAEGKVYEDTYEDVKWTFDPLTKVWTNDVTKQAVPTNAPDAPIGYEEEKEYTTEDGTEWKFDKEKNSWDRVSEDGITGSYIPAPNNYYSYDDKTGKYADVKGEEHDEAEYSGEKWEVSNDVWISEKGTTYNTKTGDVYVLVGDAVVLASELKDIESGGFYNYGRIYDSSGNELTKYVYNTGSYAWDPRTNSYGYYGEAGLVGYDPANPTKHELKDAEGNIITTWVQDRDGRWRVEGSASDTGYFGYEKYSALAEVGRNVVVDGKNYYVDSQLGWATKDENGNAYAVAPPAGQPSSDTRMMGAKGYPGYYGGYYDSATGNYVGATGCSGGCYGDYGYGTSYYGGSYSNSLGQVQQSDGTWRPATSQAEVDAAKTAGTYFAAGTSGYPPSTGATGRYDSSYIAAVGSAGYFDSSGKWVAPSAPSYTPGIHDATTGTSGYYSGGTWVSTPSTNYGGNYASYYGGYAGSGAEVGRTTTYNGQTYIVTAEKGWTDASGNAVAPPPGQPSSATGGYSSEYTGGYYSGGTWVSSGGYTGGGGYDSTGKYVGGDYGGYDASGNYMSSGSYVGTYATGPTGYFDSSGSWVAPSASSYTTGPNAWTADGTYSGSYTVGAGTYDATTGTYTYGSNTYSGGTYDPATGSYTGATSPISSGGYASSTGTYDSSTGTYSGGTTSTTGTYSGGDTSTSTSTSTSTDTSTSTSTSTSTTSTDTSTSTSTGGVISEPESKLKKSWFKRFLEKIFG